MVWAGWLFSQEWWRRELWRGIGRSDTLAAVTESFRTRFIPGADANDLILQMRTWQSHDVGATPAGADHPAFDTDVETALRSIRVPVLYMPSETDLYFPLADTRYEAAFISQVQLTPIPSLGSGQFRGHPPLLGSETIGAHEHLGSSTCVSLLKSGSKTRTARERHL